MIAPRRRLDLAPWRKAQAIAYGVAAMASVILAPASGLRAESEKAEKKPPAKIAPEAELKPMLIEPGAYEIDVSQEAADGTSIGTPVREIHCLTQEAGAGMHGFALLNPDSILRSCPSTNLREKGESLTFEIHCLGGNPAHARANFTILGTKFLGRIEVQTGNGTASGAEVQSGRRIASCPAP